MCTYVIEGGRKLSGEVYVSGSKNASLPILAATVLNNGITKLYNVPNIHDTKVMLEILKLLGCKVKRNSDKIVIDARKIDNYEIPEELMQKMRSSVILAGALLGRCNRATFSCPGGCDIGARPIDLHLKAFENLGINITEDTGYIRCKCDKIEAGKINLDFPSVGATENAILAATLASGTTTILNAAMEPEIVDLQNFLNKLGAKISGAGTSQIEIKGVSRLKSSGYKVMPDRIEAGTLLCAGAITARKYHIKKCSTRAFISSTRKIGRVWLQIRCKKRFNFFASTKKIKGN